MIADTFPVPPEPGTPRPFHLLSLLSPRTRLALVAAIPGSEERAAKFASRPEISNLFDQTYLHARKERHALAARLRTLAAGRAALELAHRDPAALYSVHETVRTLIEESGPAVFYCYGMSSLQFVPEEFWGACILDAVDAASMALERRLRTDEQISSIRRLILRIGLPGLRRYERRVLRRVGAVSYNSSVDLSYMESRCPEARLKRVIDGADLSYFDPDSYALGDEGTDIVFVGHMGFPPNADAAVHLARDIMPLVWSTNPSARVVLVGPDPPGQLQKLHDDNRTFVTGYVDDVRPYIARAAVVASPLRFGAGMKNKLQAGLAMRKAMVVSTITCEGFDDLEPGVHAIVADTPGEFAEAVCALLDDPERRHSMGIAGREFIQRSFSWESAARDLWSGLADLSPAVV